MSSPEFKNKYPDYRITPHETDDEIRNILNEAIKEFESIEDFPNVLRKISEICGEIEEAENTYLDMLMGDGKIPILRFRTVNGTRGLLRVPAPIDKWLREV